MKFLLLKNFANTKDPKKVDVSLTFSYLLSFVIRKTLVISITLEMSYLVKKYVSKNIWKK